MAVNGSPRKNWNTATLLTKALEGASSQGADTELIHLYGLNFKGCTSCFACKRKGRKSYGRCAVKDDLAEVFPRIEQADALILGSPIYFGQVTGEMRSFLERLLFQYLVYDREGTVLFPRKIMTGFLYTMNVTEDLVGKIGYEQNFINIEGLLTRFFGSSEYLTATDTYQFDDYSLYTAPRFDPEAKAKRRLEVFPMDCEKAYDMGVRFARVKSDQ